MKILEYLHIFDFSILKVFVEDFPNLGFWWSKLQPGGQYYVILYLLTFIIIIFQIKKNLNESSSNSHPSSLLKDCLIILINSFYITEMFLFTSRVCFFHLAKILNNWSMVLIVPLTFITLFLATIVLPYYIFHKITKRWTPIFPW